MLRQQMNEVDLLILGAGWTSTFLIPQLSDTDITYAATTTSGRDATIPFKFDPESGDAEPYKRLPAAKTVLITFPLVGHGQSKSIVGLYRSVHGARNNWIQLGSTGIYNKVPDDWSDEDAHYNKEDKRAIAEDELRSLHGCVLCLAGLYGGERVPARWLPRIVKSKDDIKKRGAVHFIHGEDVAQAIIATHQNFTPGKRWIVSDLRVYDWYDLIMSFSSMTESSMSQEEKMTQQQYAKWVGELMMEEDIRALPRDVSSLGRKLDSRRFWAFHGLLPRHRRLA
ncbi:hypothetical protein COCVIDRAFT_21896 [Bipolaris victoriae FI3]|uniref:NAD(P)-binding domain-containing protein n=2 Tax=Bipolaris TaxID=33194 RepID=W6Y0K4_COCC2|nr:uncharacterized protein COCCADRAFT_96544 [Bipolaris zeicola 26-R-13]XP_014562286.1 hypothetical protein COCVIDRAFT_21896 [Bipolaris victoriae FI3]EUC33232.1 hypothetical protein COCCADRAFT_96544 [Bipolaris zeicola 26-R-13]